MLDFPLFGRRLVVAAAVVYLAMVAGCGGGSADIVVVGPPPATALDIVLTRTGPQTVQVDWSDDPAVASFTVSRDGRVLAVAFTILKD